MCCYRTLEIALSEENRRWETVWPRAAGCGEPEQARRLHTQYLEESMLKQERRVFSRKRVSLRLEGRTNNGLIDPAAAGRVGLHIVELSLGGLLARVDGAVVVGSRM